MQKPDSIRPSLASREEVGPTDMSPPSMRSRESYYLKVEIRGNDALITTKDGKINELRAASTVSKRFPRGTKIGYFRACIKGGINILEIGDRLDRVPGGEW